MTTDYFAGDDRTSYERMAAGDLYVADDPEIARGVQRGLRLVDAYHRAVLDGDDDGARAERAARRGAGGEGASGMRPLAGDFGSNVHLGDRTFVNSGLTALDVAAITIGDDCLLGPNVQLLTPTHPVDPQPRRDKLEAAEPITLGDNVWRGGGGRGCPGGTRGDNTGVGAGSVVTRDLPANVVAVGNPARVIRENI